jgi:hypothetical protein
MVKRTRRKQRLARLDVRGPWGRQYSVSKRVVVIVYSLYILKVKTLVLLQVVSLQIFSQRCVKDCQKSCN